MPWLPSSKIGDGDISLNNTQYDPMSIKKDILELSEGRQLETFLTTDWLSHFETSDNWVNDGFTDAFDGT